MTVWYEPSKLPSFKVARAGRKEGYHCICGMNVPQHQQTVPASVVQFVLIQRGALGRGFSELGGSIKHKLNFIGLITVQNGPADKENSVVLVTMIVHANV